MAGEIDDPQKDPDETRTNGQNLNLIEDSAKMPDLPHEIIIDILSRLSAKTLVKFRCVSKSWRFLISDPHFIEKHLHFTTTDDNYTNHRIILTCTDPYFSLKSCSVYSIYNESSVDATELDHPLNNAHHTDRVVGSCNGLLCIAIEHENVYLWNPSIRELRRLPDSGFKWQKNCNITYGLGYDPCNDDYKVVAIFSCFGSRNSEETKVKVYTLRTNCWRRIDDFPYGPHNEPGLFVGGALNWPAVRFDGSDFEFNEHGQRVPVIHLSWNILGIDLRTEKCMEVPQPEYESDGYDRNLGSLGGCLCLLANYRGNRADFWVMKEYGVEKSWSKLVTIPYMLNLWYSDHFPYYRPLWYSKHGELLLEFKSSLVLYNSKDGTFRSPVIENFQACLKSITYVESLVLPNPGDIVERLHQ